MKATNMKTIRWGYAVDDVPARKMCLVERRWQEMCRTVVDEERGTTLFVPEDVAVKL